MSVYIEEELLILIKGQVEAVDYRIKKCLTKPKTLQDGMI